MAKPDSGGQSGPIPTSRPATPQPQAQAQAQAQAQPPRATSATWVQQQHHGAGGPHGPHGPHGIPTEGGTNCRAADAIRVLRCRRNTPLVSPAGRLARRGQGIRGQAAACVPCPLGSCGPAPRALDCGPAGPRPGLASQWKRGHRVGDAAVPACASRTLRRRTLPALPLHGPCPLLRVHRTDSLATRARRPVGRWCPLQHSAAHTASSAHGAAHTGQGYRPACPPRGPEAVRSAPCA
jgi:hypothetical protein